MEKIERHIGGIEAAVIFNRVAAREWRLFEQGRVREREKRRKEEAEKNGEDDLVALASLTIEEQVRRLSERIDSYEVATVAALQRNERELAQVQARLYALLENAHALPDGRRVFRTEDGSRVFDEHGNELSEEEIDPDSIPDGRTRWEAYLIEVEEDERLQQQRRELFEYQDRLDAARETLEEGELSEEELDDLGEELDALMPDAVREEMAGAGRVPGREAGQAGLDDPKVESAEPPNPRLSPVFQ